MIKLITFTGCRNDGYNGSCLSKDVPNLPLTGEYARNGTIALLIDPPDGTNATSKMYRFDEENKKWWPQ